MRTVEDMVNQIMTNDLPHIQARLAGLETQGRITMALVVGVIMAVVAGSVGIIIGNAN